MNHPVNLKYRDVRTLGDADATSGLLRVLVETPQASKRQYHATSKHGGQFYLVQHEAFKGKALEYVPDYAQDTSVSTLYAEHPIFESRQRLLAVREEIIGAIDVLLLSVPGTATIRDEGRNQEFCLAELGTAQLLDVLKHFSTHH